MDELAYSLNGENSHYGTPRNPAAPDRVPGGSSSGSAVAVANGDVDFALGTDTGGMTHRDSLLPEHDSLACKKAVAYTFPCQEVITHQLPNERLCWYQLQYNWQWPVFCVLAEIALRAMPQHWVVLSRSMVGSF